MKKLFVAALCIFHIGYAQSQQIVPCATDELHYEAKKQNPSIAEAEQKANKMIREQSSRLLAKQAGVIYIPVVFHVIHTNGQENITMAQINDQLRILNNDYRKRAGTTGFSDDPLAADMEIEFRLAQYDPNGNKHDGVNRVYSTLTENAGNNVKALSYWNSSRYLNIWVVKSINSNMAGGEGVVLGYAQFPFFGSASTDGVVVRADCIGKGFGTLGASQVGRTLTHEVGHWLGLYHPFQDGCVGGDSNSCSSEGDQVCDTPPVGSAATGCPTTRNSCTSDVPDKDDLIKNYMDYADGICTNMFTVGQKARAQSMVYGYRANIFSSSNLASAGIAADGSYLTSTAATLKAPYAFGFETTNLAQAGWKVFSQNNPSWAVDDTTKFSGNYAIGMRNFYSPVAVINTKDWFVSPDIDLSTLNTVYLSFDYALARRSTANNDSFNVWISNDYGMTESPLQAKIAIDLATAPNQTTNFNPDHTQWKNVSFDITQYKTYTHARFRFEFVNRRGNNVFVDNFSITSSPATGVNENLKQEFAFNVYPNPAQQNAHITFDNKQAGNIKITLKDLTGRDVKTFTNGHVSAGLQDIFITTDDVAKGIYLVHFENEKGAFSHKLVVN